METVYKAKEQSNRLRFADYFAFFFNLSKLMDLQLLMLTRTSSLTSVNHENWSSLACH